MFRESANARTYLRAALATAIAVLGVAATLWIDNPYIKLASAGVGALATYLGVGAASGSVEPFFVNQLKNVEVPAPPAVRDTDA